MQRVLLVLRLLVEWLHLPPSEQQELIAEAEYLTHRRTWRWQRANRAPFILGEETKRTADF